MKTSFTFIIFISLLIEGCSENAINPASKPLDISVISPLVTGDEWIYDLSTYDSNGVKVSDFQDTVRVGLTTEIQGQLWYLVSDNNNPNSTFYFSNQKDGYYFFDENSMTPSISFKYPASNGEVYNDHIDTIFGTGSNAICSHAYSKVVSTNENKRLGATTYSCYHYQMFQYFFQGADTVHPAPLSEQYFAPGIGRIQFTMHFLESFNPKTNVTIKNGTDVTTLESYTLK
jgi:hypothetical protein